MERYKARLVAQGFSQKYGIDYDETFSPVVRFESIRTIIALAASFKLKLNQMDIKTAFLNGELKEDIYMQQPEGFVVKESGKLVCRLKRSIYGLNQLARCWNTELDYCLKEIGFSQLDCDPCTYNRIVDGNVFVIAVYVDDIILAGHNDDIMNKVKIAIGNKFNVTDMGEMHHFLGVKVVQNYTVGKIWIGQSTYAKELLIRFKMEESNPTDTPVDVGMKLMKGKDGESVNKEKYQSVVGSLLFLSTRTRPYIAYAVGTTARFSASPTKSHWTAVKRILRYINGTLDLGLLYSNEESVNLVGFSDADWAGDQNDRKSTSGYIFQLSNGAVSWRSKKQSCVALSTAEAEYMALSSAFQEAAWMRQLLSGLIGIQVDSLGPTLIFEDNQSTICMSKNHQFHGRSKHINIKYHYVREQVAAGNIELEYCKSDDMLADIFTKGLNGPGFKKLRSMIGMTSEIKSSQD